MVLQFPFKWMRRLQGPMGPRVARQEMLVPMRRPTPNVTVAAIAAAVS
jgi:hypothetical protein